MVKSSPTPMTDADPLCRLTSRDLHDGFASGALSPVEVATAALDRAETIDAKFNAFTRIDRVAALAAATASEKRWRDGEPLSLVDGVPTTIKDIVSVKDWPIRFGSLSTDATPCAADAPAVVRLRDAGVTFLGLTTTPEFGWKALTDSPFSGITRNPWNPTMTPGGSSGGAAVAAATGAGVFHLGTDGGGSIRVPAAFTGVTGIKPTYGRVPAYPASAYGTVAHLGPMTRGVADTQAMLDIMSGTDPSDWLQGPAELRSLDHEAARFQGARIGYWSTPPCGTLDPEIAATVDDVVRQLEGLGAVVEPIDLPDIDVLDTFNVLWYSGGASRLASLSPEARARVDPNLLAMATIGETFSAVRYVKAMGARADFGLAMDRLMSRFDLIVSPATAISAFEVGNEIPPGSGLNCWIEWAGFSFPINLSQQPACTVPCGQTAGGLPIGLQMIGARGADGAVLAYAAAFENAFPAQFL